MIKGFMIMKAMPFHKGHEALIEYAKANCDYLTILVAAHPDEPIPYKYRLKWVLSTYLDDPQIEVFGDIVTSEPEFDDSEQKSVWWGNYVTAKYGQFSRVFSSEDYGDVFAKTMHAENWVFDKSRTIMPISGTALRKRPLTNWDYLNNFAKDYFVKKIAIIGTESTGKTTLAKQLAEDFNTVWVPEAGRNIVQDSKEFSYEDLVLIGTEHAKNIIHMSRLANRVMFIDTNLAITKSYARHFFGRIPDYAPWIEKANECDYYIYLDQSAPYVDDGTRLPKKERDILAVEHEKLFKEEGIDYKSYSFIPHNSVDSIQKAYDYRYFLIKNHLENFISMF